MDKYTWIEQTAYDLGIMLQTYPKMIGQKLQTWAIKHQYEREKRELELEKEYGESN